MFGKFGDVVIINIERFLFYILEEFGWSILIIELSRVFVDIFMGVVVRSRGVEILVKFIFEVVNFFVIMLIEVCKDI